MPNPNETADTLRLVNRHHMMVDLEEAHRLGAVQARRAEREQRDLERGFANSLAYPLAQAAETAAKRVEIEQRRAELQGCRRLPWPL